VVFKTLKFGKLHSSVAEKLKFRLTGLSLYDNFAFSDLQILLLPSKKKDVQFLTWTVTSFFFFFVYLKLNCVGTVWRYKAAALFAQV